MKKTTITCDCCGKELEERSCIHVEIKATVPAKQYDNVTTIGFVEYSYSGIQSVFIAEHEDVKSLDYCESCYEIWKENHLKIINNYAPITIN